MRYALIADIHGNFPALEAVVLDAKRENADKFIFLGDYYQDFPYPNEVTNRIKSLDAVVISGNKEERLAKLRNESCPNFELEQFGPLYWSFNELRPDNLEYLTTLPRQKVLINPHGNIHLSHSAVDFTRVFDKGIFMSYNITREEAANFEQSISNFLTELDLSELDELDVGVYAFGHTHLQWHFEHNGRLFVNPGSCGLPTDFNSLAPYTIIDDSTGKWQVSPRRVSYDIENTISVTKASPLYSCAKIWCELAFSEIRNGEDLVSSFLWDLEKRQNALSKPDENTVWRQAESDWLSQHGIS